jgi:cell division protein FtsW
MSFAGRIIRDYHRYFFVHRWILLIPLCVIFLNVLGMIILSSASLSFLKYNYLSRQVTWLVIALGCCLFAACLPVQFLQKNAAPLHKISLLLLGIVLIPYVGISVNGSRRWLQLGISHLQVSEFAKVTFSIYFAHLLAETRGDFRNICGLFFYLFQVGIFAFLLLMEPDYGATALFFFVGMALLFLNGYDAKILSTCVALALLIFAVAVTLNPVRMARILSFMNIEATKLGGSYQLWQGLVGFNSGGIFGVGLGNGRQQLYYLPEAHTDFIFPILAEELGYLFSLIAIVAYGIIFLVAWIEIYHVHSPFRFLLANGIILFLVVQAIVNLCVVMGMLPTKGIALPFMSYGGSHLIFSYFSIGLLLNIFKTSYVEEVLH